MNNLTANQTRIVDAVATGRTIKEVADYLDRRPQTIFNTLAKIYERLDIPHNVSALAVWRVCTVNNLDVPEFIRRASAMGLVVLMMMHLAFDQGQFARVRRSGRRCEYEIVDQLNEEE